MVILLSIFALYKSLPRQYPVLMLNSYSTCHENTQSILLVDDNEIILESLFKAFNVFGFNVFKAENGFDAWELFKEWSIDIVLTDIRMPNMDGVELSRLIRNRFPQTTIAVMTGGDPELATGLLNDGTADHFFAKPFNLSYVRKTLSTKILYA